MPAQSVWTIAVFAAWLIASAHQAAAAEARCDQSHPLAEALIFQIRAKMKVLDNPAEYCRIEKLQLKAAQTYYDWVHDDPDCFRDEPTQRHLLDLASKAVVSAKQDVAADCK